MTASRRDYQTAGAAVGLLLSLLAPLSVARADEIKPLAPDERAFGLTLGEWGAAWWQWFLSIPAATNPNTKRTGVGRYAGIGQRMPVWFLPSYIVPGVSSAGSFTVSCTIPEGYSLLLLPRWAFSGQPPGRASEDELRTGLVDLDQVTVMEVSVDGIPIPDAKQYRATTPLFSAVLPPGNIFNEQVNGDVGFRLTSVADGFWFLLPPLSPGKHVIQTRSELIWHDGSLNIREMTYHLTIVRQNEPIP